MVGNLAALDLLAGFAPRPGEKGGLAPAWLICLLLILGLVTGNAGYAQGSGTLDETESELEGVRRRIERLAEGLSEARNARAAVEMRLAATGIELGKVVRELRDIGRRMKAAEQELTRLEAKRNEQSRALESERAVLGRQVRAAYVLGRHDYLEVLFNQEGPAALRRMLIYYGYINRARTERIAAINDRLARLDALEKGIGAETEALLRLQAEQIAARGRLGRRRADRNQLMAKMQSEITSKRERIEELKSDERRLRGILDALRTKTPRLPEAPLAPDRPFAALRGTLTWPVAGIVRHKFGTSRRPGNLTWSGVWLAAREGESVRAVSNGQVVYADWLRGFGLLLIIDHGDGYMTLYGHNQALFKETGEWVEAGEVIGATGNAGPRLGSGVYFEIRHRGSPLDPEKWSVPTASGGRTVLVTR